MSLRTLLTGKEEKTHALNKSEKNPVDDKESYEEVLNNNTKHQPPFQINRRLEVKLQKQSRLTFFSLLVPLLLV